MLRARILWILTALGISAWVAACGSDSPTDSGDTGAYIYTPSPGSYSLDVFDTFRVTVRARNGSAVDGVFSVDRDSMASGSEYAWWATSLGAHELRFDLSSPGESETARWSLQVEEGQAPPPDGVTQLVAGRGEVPGSINLLWERPALNYETIDLYRVYYDTQPIDADALAGVPMVEVPHNAGTVEQEVRLEDLQEEALHYMRIQIVDLIGREAELSPEISSVSTGHYRVSGRITRLVETPGEGGAEGFPNVLIEVGEYKTLTDTDGYYDLDDIPDVLRTRLSAKPTAGADPFTFYWCLTDTLDTEEQGLDLLLIRRKEVLLNRPQEERVFMLEYLLEVMAKQAVSANKYVQRWETYPIPIRVDPLVVSPGGGDIGASLVKGIAAWNEAANEVLFVEVSGEPSYGSDYAVVENQPGSVLGEVRMVDPANSQCLFQCIPRQVVVQMSRQNNQNVMERVAVHELGHVLWLTHSRHSDHVLSDGVHSNSPLLPQTDEVLAARYVRHIPNGTSMLWYQEPQF